MFYRFEKLKQKLYLNTVHLKLAITDILYIKNIFSFYSNLLLFLIDLWMDYLPNQCAVKFLIEEIYDHAVLFRSLTAKIKWKEIKFTKLYTIK